MIDKPINILLIEDNPADAELLEEYLNDEIADFDVVHAVRLREGILHLGRRKFDVILLDLSLPDGEGMPVVDEVRDLEDSPPIIILTGREDEGMAIETLQKGIQDYLPKNRLTGEILARSIRYAIERRQSELKIRQAQRMEAIGQLAGGVAHDFNNLLTIIQGYSDLAQEQIGAREMVMAALGEISKASVRASALTKQLLSFSRTKVWSPRELDVNEVLEEMKKMLTRLISEDVAVHFRLPPGIKMIKADAGQIEQIVLNLAINGRDAMEDGGTLTVATLQVELDDGPEIPVAPGTYIRITVSDTGTGIGPGLLSSIFDPFVTTKEAGRGTGLGLSTVKGIVEEMKGWIAVESTVGIGTAFHVHLPVFQDEKTAAEAEQAAVAPSAPPRPTGRKTIMVIDDESDIRKILALVLKRHDYVTITVSSPREAIEAFESKGRKVDLVLTDIVMPGMNGVELANRLQALQPDLKFLFMSGYPMDSLSRQKIDVSQLTMLQKPFNPDKLINTLQEFL